MIRLAWPPPQRWRATARTRDRLVRSRSRSGPAARDARSSTATAVWLGRRLVPRSRCELPVAVAQPRSPAARALAAARRWLWARWRPLAPHALPAGLAALCLVSALAFAVAMLRLEASLSVSEPASSSSSAR